MTTATGTRTAGANQPRITIERTYLAPIEDVWALWTTRRASSPGGVPRASR